MPRRSHSDSEDERPATRRVSALQLGPRKRPKLADPLVHHGRHFGRTVHALCSVSSLIKEGLLRMGEWSDQSDENFSAQERYEYQVFNTMLQTIPGLDARLFNSDTGAEETEIIASLIQKGISQARSDDTKTMKGPILDWITPVGQSLEPPIARNSKHERGFNHPRTGQLLCPTGLDWSDHSIQKKLRDGELVVPGDQWPIFLYAGYKFDPDDPWKGLLRSQLLVMAFKHVFTSPSSVDKEIKATRSGNARIHGMKKVTPASLAYIATQVRFALSSSAVFSRSDTTTDSERFYGSINELLEDPDEEVEVKQLLQWWNRLIFPGHDFDPRPVSANSALAKIRERRQRLKAAQTGAHAE